LQKKPDCGYGISRRRWIAHRALTYPHFDLTFFAGATGGTMAIAEILASIDREIAYLKQARELLAAGSSRRSEKIASTSKKAAAKTTAKAAKRKKRVLTPEGRKRIAEAQKQRWEAQKKAAVAGQK
jgi:hypothetical protein